ncbi:hypothetical protein [Phaeobacter inhibens]|uniref:hypothetical protein n=1 Tax=Phaeobacter inhibens TaxID=221822 RepID=UPI000CA36524|nr:hypothetical protein [Phaeobacter inhibens]AUQ68362.1 hypothetical protein PhaeoP78_03545 [Phaeobacter inhibens]
MTANSAVAGYRPEKMMIRIGSGFRIIDDEEQPVEIPTANAFGVFLHEYFHYVHNISAATGLTGFINTLEIWRLFRTTIDETGYSAGHNKLSENYHKHYTTLHKLFHAIRTVHKPKLKENFKPTSIEISSAEEPIETVGDTTGTLLSAINCQAKVEDDHGASECHTIKVGVQEIMEAAAWLLERRYVNQSDPNASPLPAEVFPYQVVRALVDYKLDNADDDSILACILAALHSTNPPEALMGILELAKAAENDDKSVFDAVHMAVKDTVDSNETQLIDQLDNIEKEFCGDSIMAVGIRTITSRARTALQLRSLEPLFEIAFVDLLSNKEVSIGNIMNKIPACNVLQENSGSIEDLRRDFLVSFSPISGDNWDPEVGLRVIHVIFDFMLGHISENGFLTTNQLPPKRCPFYTTCDLPLRKKYSAICGKTPWKSVEWDGWGQSGKCDYATAIAITRPPI